MTTTGSIGSSIRKQAKPAVMIFFLLTLIVGILYPLVVTGIAQVAFPVQSNGDLLIHNGQVAGSSQIGQPFSSPQYFWGRLSATSPVPYNAGASGGSNLGPNNPALVNQSQARVDALHAADPTNTKEIPVDLVTASGSGLDPDISPLRTTRFPELPGNATSQNPMSPHLSHQRSSPASSGYSASPG